MSWMRKVCRVFIFNCCCYHFSNSQKVTLSADKNHKGTSVEVSLAECTNVPDELARQATAVNTQDNCARLYDALNCTGNVIQVMPASPTHADLRNWDFNDKIMSVGPCELCDKRITGDAPEVDEEVDLEIYGQPHFKGARKKLSVKGCMLIPTRFTLQLLSLKTFGRCFQFYRNVECQLHGGVHESIEVRPGTPFHENMGWWHFSPFRAVSHCTYKCNETVKELYTKLYQSQSKVAPEKPHEVVLYDRKNYSGNAIHFTVVNCLDIQNEWEGAAISIKSFNGSCVTLYETRGCAGESINVVGSNPDLSSRNFDALTRSMRPCNGILLSPEDGKSDPGPTRKGGFGSAQPSTQFSPLLISIIVVVPLFGVILSIFLALMIIRRCNPYMNIMDKLSEKEVEEFLRGLGMDLGSNAETNIEEDYTAELLAQNRPYNDAYEMVRSNIKFDPQLPLGMGEFGIVYKGTVQVLSVADDDVTSKIKTIQVAVKTVKPGSSVQCLRSLLKEVKVMLYVGVHDRIVQMIGCCTENLRKGEILVLMEFCPNGSLERFLQKNKGKYKNFVKKGRLELDEENLNLSKTGYIKLREGLLTSFDLFQLLHWCIEIAKGMEFLTSKKVIHSDLAARNVLLDENFRTKISDFGLSRQLYCYTQYVKKKMEPLPWRYLAIESLTNLQFSSQSDVWSFGVLCWEIFTLGEKPYPGVLYNNDFLRNLQEGMRMAKPKYTISECYNLMIRCWAEEPNNRPSFTEIHEELQEILASLQPSQIQSNPNYSTFA